MPLTTFTREYEELTPGDQALFAEAIRRLLAEGIIWREDEADRRVYNFLARRRELIADYLQVAGWDLRFDERIALFHVVHRDGAHTRRLSRDTTIWLLLLRLIYAEQRESLSVTLTRYPVTSVGDLAARYATFFPGKAVRKKTSLEEALRALQRLKLIRPAGGSGTLGAGDNEQLIELLPALEIVVPAAEISAVAKRLREFDGGASNDSDDSADAGGE